MRHRIEAPVSTKNARASLISSRLAKEFGEQLNRIDERNKDDETLTHVAQWR
jgi:hypothetical protein